MTTVDLRLYAIIDPSVGGGYDLADLAGRVAAGGATLVQLRDKGGPTRTMVEEARAIKAVLIPFKVPLVVNDRVDVALAAGADGVHLGQDDMTATDARNLLGPTAIIGLSVSSVAEAEAAPVECIDYVGIGSVYATASKQLAKPPIGAEGFARIAAVLRRLRPRVVILPYWQGRHPDHYTSATLGYEACFAAGLARLDLPAELGAPHRPYKILYASLYADIRPTFVVDITAHIETRLQSLLAYRSQYGTQPTGAGLFVPEEDIRERTFATARHFGLLAGVRYAEPFVQREVSLADDLMMLPVQSI